MGAKFNGTKTNGIPLLQSSNDDTTSDDSNKYVFFITVSHKYNIVRPYHGLNIVKT